jgi:hypothetical protein
MEVFMDEPVYVGQGQVLHYWPSLMAAAAMVGGLFGGTSVALLLLVPGVVVALALPWRFAALDRGVALWFRSGSAGTSPRSRSPCGSGTARPSWYRATPTGSAVRSPTV